MNDIEVADLYVTLRGISDEFSASMAEAGAASEEADGKIASLMSGVGKVGLGFAAAGLAVGAASVKMAMDFEASMTQLSTLAGVPKASLAGLSNDVLNLAGQVGESPDSLAAALYHVESSFASLGITSQGAMNILKVAAEGAKVGGADLVDVTNALDAAISSGIPGVQNYQQAMGALLKIVGSGDMTMQDFADAASTGILATAKVYGNSLTDVGAALATFGDNNIRGQNAATDLKMSIMDLTKQSSTGQAALAGIGITAGQLGQDMQTGGFNKAITDLHTHLLAAGDGGAKMGEVLEDAFTKKSSAPLAILLDQFDRLESKYPDIASGASNFANAWQQTQATFKQQVSEITAGAEALGIRLGEAIIPVLQKVIGAVQGVIGWFQQHKKITDDLGTALKYLAIGTLPLVAIGLYGVAAAVVAATWEFVAIAAAIGGAAYVLKKLYDDNAGFHAFVDEVATKGKAAFQEFASGVSRAVTDIRGWLESHRTEIAAVFATVKQDIDTAIGVFERLGSAIGHIVSDIGGFLQAHQAQVEQTFGDIEDVVTAVAGVFQSAFDAIVAVVDVAITIITDLWDRFGQHLLQHLETALNALLQSIRGVLEIIKGVFDVFAGLFTGNWSKFWKGITEIFGGAWNVVLGLFKTFVNDFSTGLGAFVAVFTAVWDMLWHAMQTAFFAAWTPIVDFFENIGSDIGHWFAGAASWLVKAGGDIIRGIGQGILNAWNAITDWFHNVGSSLVAILAGAGTWLFDVGKNIVEGLWNGISGAGSWFISKIEQWVSDHIPKPIQWALQILSPSRVMADIGQYIPMGLAKGILDNSNHVDQAMTAMTAKVTKLGSQQVKIGANYTATVGGIAGLGGGVAGGSGVAGLAGGSGGVTQVMQVTVQGSVIDYNGFFQAMQTAQLRFGQKNSMTFQPYKR